MSLADGGGSLYSTKVKMKKTAKAKCRSSNDE